MIQGMEKSNGFDGLNRYWQLFVFVITMTFAMGRTWSEFQQQDRELEVQKARIEEINTTLHRRISGMDDDVEKLDEKVQRNTAEMMYIKGRTDQKNLTHDSE